MLRKYLLAVWVLTSLCIGAHAASSFGGGIYIGNPTGVKFKANLNSSNALSSLIAWDIPGDMVYASVDYAYNFYYSIKDDEGRAVLPIFLYTGPGVRIKSNNNNTNVGIKFTGGAGMRFKDIPIELFLEISPILDIVPATDLDLNAGIGVILYFM